MSILLELVFAVSEVSGLFTIFVAFINWADGCLFYSIGLINWTWVGGGIIFSWLDCVGISEGFLLADDALGILLLWILEIALLTALDKSSDWRSTPLFWTILAY